MSASPHLLPEDPGPGFDSADVLNTVKGLFRDAGYLPTFIRVLSKRGVWTTNNKNYCRSGAAVTGTIPAKLDEMFLQGNYRPQCVIAGAGTNDAANLSTNLATFETNVKAMITTCEGKKVSYMLFWTVPSLRATSTYRTAGYDALLLSINTIILALPAWSVAQGYTMKVGVCDVFTKFGGHSINAQDFGSTSPGTENIHPSDQGSNKLGIWMAQALLELAI